MNFGVFVYDGTEAIDLATFGVLSMARRIRPEINIQTIAPTPRVVTLANGLRVVPDFDMRMAPCPDVLIVTGGPGWGEQVKDPEILEFIRRSADTSILVSVCTGGLILAASGVLDGKTATTKCETVPPEISPLKRMRETYREIDVRHAGLVAHDKVITGGGVTLCIDTTLYVLEKLFGHAMAAETARILEYNRAWAANRQQFPSLIC
jgi:transcriptional regulator GlxA family with amidase domain